MTRRRTRNDGTPNDRAALPFDPLFAIALAACAAAKAGGFARGTEVFPHRSGAAGGRTSADPAAATPPAEAGNFRKSDLVELTSLDATIKLDIRYATTRNFLGTPLYSQARAFLQRPAAEALARVQKSLAPEGFGLLVHDAYRPWYVTKIFWDATPPDKHEFVADPASGSRHNRGCAVDLTFVYAGHGQAVEMPSLYDEMSERAYPAYAGGPEEPRRLREPLRRHMEAEGFTVSVRMVAFRLPRLEAYAIQNARFEDIAPAGVRGTLSMADPRPSPGRSRLRRRDRLLHACHGFRTARRQSAARCVGARRTAGQPRLLLLASRNAEQRRIGNQTGGRVFLFLHTDDFARDHRTLTDKGVRFIEEPRHEDYGTVAVFEDRYGNRWDLIEYKS
jgi:D-alanyl-D-alanine dipeptidase